MVTKWNGPPLLGTKRRAGKNLPFGNLNDSDSTSTASRLQFMRRRAAGLEPFRVILNDLAERGCPICTATTEVVP